MLAEARLLMALRRPDAACRLLALDRELDTRLSTSGWIADLLATERADTLLAAGEPQRALAALTPLPQHTVVEATLVAAAARRDVGDFRGAQAVLSTVTSDLERAPLSLLIRAQLLEAALAQTRGQRPRARLLVDRALSFCLPRGDSDPDHPRVAVAAVVRQPGPRPGPQPPQLPIHPGLRPHSGSQTNALAGARASRWSGPDRTRETGPRTPGADVLHRRDRPCAARVAQHRQDPPQGHLRQTGREPSGRRRTPWPPVGALLTRSRPTRLRSPGSRTKLLGTSQQIVVPDHRLGDGRSLLLTDGLRESREWPTANCPVGRDLTP